MRIWSCCSPVITLAIYKCCRWINALYLFMTGDTEETKQTASRSLITKVWRIEDDRCLPPGSGCQWGQVKYGGQCRRLPQHTGVSPLFLGCHVIFDVRGQGQDSASVMDQGAKELHSHSGSFSLLFCCCCYPKLAHICFQPVHHAEMFHSEELKEYIITVAATVDETFMWRSEFTGFIQPGCTTWMRLIVLVEVYSKKRNADWYDCTMSGMHNPAVWKDLYLARVEWQ